MNLQFDISHSAENCFQSGLLTSKCSLDPLLKYLIFYLPSLSIRGVSSVTVS